MIPNRTDAWAVTIVALLLATVPAVAAEPLRFNRDIRPILSDNCFNCHGPASASRQADLRLDQRDSAVDTGAIVPGKPDESELLRRVLSEDHDAVMPPPETKKSLTAEQKNALRRWIEEGAQYEPHWAFMPVPEKTTVPRTEGDAWSRNDIDRFVLHSLQQRGLTPAEGTTREQWLRRVTFDLTGLPPTLEELDAFLADTTPQAYEVVVDRLLTAPTYGERLANDWLDVARYADTFGFQADRDMHVWPWRDWVIRSFNENLPYDDFIVQQIAGDMLDDPTRDQILATAFNRLHRQTNEGGSIEEEFRIEYVADRVRTAGTAFLALTLECARCHDHKYDPISQREYYQLTAFFNNIDEHGLYSHFTETAPTPTLNLYEGDQEDEHRLLRLRVAETQAELEHVGKLLEASPDGIPEVPMPAAPVATTAFGFEGLTDSGDYRAVEGRSGKAIAFGGDDAFSCGDAGAFTRVMPFSFSLWVKATEHQPRQIVFHRSRAAEDSAYRGYSLTLDSGHPTFSLVHFWPGNALQLKARDAIPINGWVHLGITYDGSSRAAGTALYVNGERIECDVIRDGLSRDIIHRQEWGDYDVDGVKLALGARFRDVGFKGGLIDDFLVFDSQLSAIDMQLLAGHSAEEALALSSPQDKLQHLALHHDQQSRELRERLLAARTAENDFASSIRQVMVMREQPQQRQTYLLARGAYDARMESVRADVPTQIVPLPADAPRNRLGFAQWLVEDSHPLTSRVAVNRFWQVFFGRGLVATAEDFGSQGQLPSHPELLDWLARDFMASGWDVKRLCRQIVLSSTYRQSSVPGDPKLYATDPDNVLLSRGPRHRLPAEQVRDNALAVSGLLVNTVGGPSVYPYQPAGLWEESGTGKHYSQSTGAGLYRRSMYSFWRRTSPPPVMTTFDAPSREYCIARRERTATPLQSLIQLNDPQMIEAARVLAEKLLKKHSDSAAAQLTDAFRLLTSRQPTPAELHILSGMLKSQQEHFDAHTERATSYVSTGQAPRDAQLNPTSHAALTAVIQALMSFDECVTKR